MGMLVQGFLREVGSEAVLSMPAYAVSPCQGRANLGGLSMGRVERKHVKVMQQLPQITHSKF